MSDKNNKTPEPAGGMEDPFEAIRIDDGIPPSAKPASLKHFIDENHNLLTALAVFVTLTAFSSKIDMPDIQIYLPALFLFGSVLILIELLANVPTLPHSWRLDLFQRLLVILPIGLGYYWVRRYPWVVGLGFMFFFTGLIVALTGFVHWLFGRFLDSPLRRLRLAGTKRRRQLRFMLVF